jgi:MoxR-like ATPase
MSTSSEHLPLAPLLSAYVRGGVPTLGELHRLPDLGPRFAAVLSASVKFLYADYLDAAPDHELSVSLGRFYEACAQPPLHGEALRRRLGIVRHGMVFLLRGRASLAEKVDACLAPGSPYHVPGLGPSFWSAVLQGLLPARHPGWLRATSAGLRRLGLLPARAGDSPGAVYAEMAAAYGRILALAPALTALHVDHFLSLVAALRGRSLPDWRTQPAAPCPVTAALFQERSRLPLRQRLRRRGPEIARAQEELQAGLAQADGKRIGTALACADPEGADRAPLDWGRHAETLTLWVGRLWEADDPIAMLAGFWQADPLPGAGLWLPAAVLHLRDPLQFAPWSDALRQGFARIDDSSGLAPPAEGYRAFNEGLAWLRERHHLHPLEVPAVLAELAEPEEGPGDAGPPEFAGFCADTFAFLGELAQNNHREWMEHNRPRYRFAVREPLVELCRTLARRYVAPVLVREHGWPLETEARPGRALTSVCKNAYGRSRPYNTTLWITFCPPGQGGRRKAAQLFVRLDAAGLRWGLRLGRAAREAVRRFRGNVERYAELLHRGLEDRGALEECCFGPADGGESSSPRTPADLRAWATGRSFEIGCARSADEVACSGEDLAGDILLTFDRLVPAYACAILDDAGPFLATCTGGAASPRYNEADFLAQTHLSADWLQRARGLLDLKRQLILQGVPGTGKTHVARSLAHLLTGGREEAVRLVQLHPAYTYEEFVEGIKVRSVAVEGRHDVTYPVEDGLLCAFAAEAARHPSEPYVLVIDEINRGNLPRVFGELLYLLEYRDQEVVLPCSRRRFRLPANLYLLGTMNAADRSVALLDQALRRRFSFLDMPPDAGILAAWLRRHAPAAGPAFAERVLGLFERLNARLRADLGPHGQVGHSYFMVPGLDEARLRAVWEHHIGPQLEEHFRTQPGRREVYAFDSLFHGDAGRSGRRRQPAGSPS